MADKDPKIGCVVVNYNGCSDTLDCLDSLQAQTYPNIDVYVVDNASTDGSREMLPTQFPDCNYIWNDTNLNWVLGVNQGLNAILAAGAEYSLILNNDVVLTHDAVANLCKRMLADPRVGAVSPKIYYAESDKKVWYAGSKVFTTLGLSWNTGNRRTDAPRYSRYKETEVAAGACMLVRNSVLDEVGPMSLDFVPLCWDDVDLSFRIKKAGYKVAYEPEGVIYHKVSTSLGQFSAWKMGLKAEKSLVFIRKHGTPIQKIVALAGYPFGLFSTTALYFLLTRDWRIWASVLKGGLKGLTRQLSQNDTKTTMD